MKHECEDCTDTDLCEHHEREWIEAEKDREFEEKKALGYLDAP